MRKPASAKQLTFELFYHVHKPFFSRAQAFFVVSANLYRREQKRGGQTCGSKRGDADLRKGGGGQAYFCSPQTASGRAVIVLKVLKRWGR